MECSKKAQWLWEGCVMERRERRSHNREFKQIRSLSGVSVAPKLTNVS